MKKLFVPLIIVLALATGADAQTYLVNTFTPVRSYRYQAYKYEGPYSQKVSMSGGLDWYGGFTIGHGVGPYTPGFAEFELGGQYETMLFVVGHKTTGSGAGGTGVHMEPGIVTIYADGVKVRDGMVYPYGVPKRISLDVRGVNKLEFRLVKGYSDIAFGEVTLWKADEEPQETGNLITSNPEPIELSKDVKSYFHNVNIKTVPCPDVRSIRINGQKYVYGLDADIQMPLSGKNSGWSYFNLRKQYSRLSFIAGPQDGTTHGTGWMTVKADGKIIWEWEVNHDDMARLVTLDVKDCEMLSFHTEHVTGNLNGGFAKIMAYPDVAQAPQLGEVEVPADPRLKTLPDACRLMSNIRPFAVESSVDKQIFDGASDYITFSMGGERFSEGFVLYETASFWDDNIISYTVFDLGREFDYLSFTAGYIGKSWSMNNDLLRVYADDELVLETVLMATAPNQEFTVPLKKCRKLRFENRGSGNLKVGAFGVADLVLYRGNPVDNDLFTHPKPECPDQIDLLDLGMPYIHYVSTMEDAKDGICYDGSTMKTYYQVGDRRVNKGFLLQTSTHFSLDHGPLADGTSNATAGMMGAAAVGSAFVAGGAAVGGAVVGSTLIGAAAFLVLAAGGQAVENSCAAFNTYGEYNSLTFTVACYRPYMEGAPSSEKESLWIGTDGVVAAELTVYETMEPMTITIPIKGCSQLMFWLANTRGTSGQYVFYDLKLSKDRLAVSIPEKARISKDIVSKPLWNSPDTLSGEWKRPASSNNPTVDYYFYDVSDVQNGMVFLLQDAKPKYDIYTTFLKGNDGDVYKAVRFSMGERDFLGEFSIRAAYDNVLNYLQKLRNMRDRIDKVSKENNAALAAILSLGPKETDYEAAHGSAMKVLDECAGLVDAMIEDKISEGQYIERLVKTALDIDGKESTEKIMYCPVFPEDEVPDGGLMLIENYNPGSR